MAKKWLVYIIIALVLLIIPALVLSIWYPIGQSFRIVFGLVYLLFLPGFVWSWVFWPKPELEKLERIILSLVLSVSLVPLTVFLSYKIHIKINVINSILEILGLVVSGLIIILARQKLSAKNK